MKRIDSEKYGDSSRNFEFANFFPQIFGKFISPISMLFYDFFRFLHLIPKIAISGEDNEFPIKAASYTNTKLVFLL